MDKKNKNKKTKVDAKSKSKNKRSSKKDQQAKGNSIISVNKHRLTEYNTYLFHEGKNYEAYNILGAHVVKEKNKKGVRFTTWAPKAKSVSVVGDFSDFIVKEENRMERITIAGLYSIFIEGIEVGEKYKFAIETQTGEIKYKSDPYAFYSELRPNTASIVYHEQNFKWEDSKWVNKRKKVNIYESPVNVYEMHLGSWKMNGEEYLTYSELSNVLPKYLKEMGYTHVEFMPLVEHPLDASWGYQGIGYYSVTSRYGTPLQLKELIQELHKEDIGVIMDWVPGHFCKDVHGLIRFDGTATYEYEEEWKADNKGWGTYNFDLGRTEVKSFLISNALYWFREFHIDGLRVDAVSNMLYLNYGREPNEWLPNKFGGNGSLEGIQFIKDLNKAVFSEFPTALMVAEESTSWPNVCKPIEHDGLGFNFKWNMGWMNDTLKYIELDPIYRKYHQNNLTFSIMYNYSENFMLSVSHDEVVHGKKSLLNKMWGDYWNKFAGLRLFTAYMMGHPGKKLLFMGAEFGQFIEWREYEQLEWKLIDKFPMHKDTQGYFKELNKFYKENKALWEKDYSFDGFQWIDADNSEQSVISFIRRGKDELDTLIFICNFTPVVYYDFNIGVPYLKDYVEAFNTDNKKYGGSGQVIEEVLVPENKPCHNQPYKLSIKVPPMATVVLKLKEENEGEV